MLRRRESRQGYTQRRLNALISTRPRLWVLGASGIQVPHLSINTTELTNRLKLAKQSVSRGTLTAASKPPHPAEQHVQPTLPVAPRKNWQHLDVQKKLTQSIKFSENLVQLSSIIVEHGNEFNAIHSSAAITHVAQMVERRNVTPREMRMLSGLLGRLVELIRHTVQLYEARGVANTIHALGTLEYYDKELVVLLLDRAEGNAMASKPQHLSNTFWGLAKLKHQPASRWLEGALGACMSCLTEFSAQELSNLLWAIATLRIKVSNMWLDNFCMQVKRRLPTMTAQGITNILWSLASLDVSMPTESGLAMLDELLRQADSASTQALVTSLHSIAKMGLQPNAPQMKSILSHLSKHLRTANNIDLSTLIWALAVLGYCPPKSWCQEFQRVAVAKVYLLSPRHLSIITWAVAKLSMPYSEEWFRRHEPFSFEELGKYHAQDLANTIWGLAVCGQQPSIAWLDAFAEQAHFHASSFKPMEIANVIWGMAKFQHRPSELLFLELFAGTDRRLSAFKPAELSCLIWSLARLQRAPDKEWSEELLKATFHKLPQMDCQSLALTLWSLSELHLLPPPAWMYSFVAACRPKLADFNAIDLEQLVKGLSWCNTSVPLQKVEDFLTEVVGRTALVELQSMAYSKTQVDRLLRMSPKQRSRERQRLAWSKSIFLSSGTMASQGSDSLACFEKSVSALGDGQGQDAPAQDLAVC